MTCIMQVIVFLVPGAGIEPARIAARDFESRASTNSATRAFGNIHYCIIATVAIIASYSIYENRRFQFLFT